MLGSGSSVFADDSPPAKPDDTTDLKLGEAVQAGLKQAEETVKKLGEQLQKALQDFKLPTTGEQSAPETAAATRRRRSSMLGAWIAGSSSSESKEVPNEVTPIVDTIAAPIA